MRLIDHLPEYFLVEPQEYSDGVSYTFCKVDENVMHEVEVFLSYEGEQFVDNNMLEFSDALSCEVNVFQISRPQYNQMVYLSNHEYFGDFVDTYIKLWEAYNETN